MKHISILVPKGAILGSIEGPRQLLTQVNHFYKAKNLPPPFHIQLVGLTKETPLCGGLVTIHADLLLESVKKTDLIIIPAIDGELSSAVEANKDFIPWILKLHNAGAEVASLCIGAFLLASTGLMDGRKCATHWLAANEFKKMFPQVNLIMERVITDEKGIYTSGGAYSYLNLILYLIEKFSGREMAVLCAKVFAIEIERESQSPFMIFQGQKEHEDEPIRKAQEYIETNYQEKITVDQLASMFALIENAADPVSNSGDWLGGFREMLRTKGYQLERVDLRQWLNKEKELRQKLASKDVIWIGGGHTYYLRWILQQTGADMIIRELVSKGKVYAGWSAGAVVAGPTLKFFDTMDDPDDSPGVIMEGLSLTNIVVVPHLDNRDFADDVQVTNHLLQQSGYKTLLLSDEQALVVDGNMKRII